MIFKEQINQNLN